MTAELVDRFAAQIVANAGAAHGPLPPRAAVELACARAAELAGGRPVAVPARDTLLDAHSVSTALGASGLDLVAPDAPGWRDAVARCRVGVTGSLAAVATTGSVAVGHGPGSPRAVSLVPDAHVCLVSAARVRETFEEALPLAMAGGLPPNLVWISGPSRSADIEKQITLGVHGPRTFEVVLVDGGDEDRAQAEARRLMIAPAPATTST